MGTLGDGELALCVKVADVAGGVVDAISEVAGDDGVDVEVAVVENVVGTATVGAGAGERMMEGGLKEALVCAEVLTGGNGKVILVVMVGSRSS